MKDKRRYPEEFLEINKWDKEKIEKEKNNIKLEILEKRQFEMLFIGIVLLFLFIIAVFPNRVLKISACIGVLLVCLILIIYMYFKNKKISNKKNEFKEKVLEEFAIHIKDGFIYEKNGEISELKYRKSGFNKSYNEFESNCCMSGEKNGRKIGIANITIEKHDKDNKKKICLFKGAFAFCELNENIDEIDVMKVDSKINKKEKAEIKEENLYMYSEDIKYANKIVDEKIIQLVKEVKREFDITLEFMIHKNGLYVRFFTDNMLLFSVSDEKEVLYKYYRLIEFMNEFAETIEKNVK